MKRIVKQRRKIKFDEINALVKEISVTSEAEYYALSPQERKRRKDKFWDCLWGWLIDGWAAGLLFVDGDKDIPDLTHILNWIYPRGETTSEIYDKDVTDPEKLQTMIECEANRCFNCGVMEAVKDEKGVIKTWETMGDERVRLTHDYLEGMTLPYDEEFVTIGGDSALAPGLFSDPENNVNCRCWLTVKRGNKAESL